MMFQLLNQMMGHLISVPKQVLILRISQVLLIVLILKRAPIISF